MDDWSDLLKLLNNHSDMESLECPHCKLTCFWGSEELQAHVIVTHGFGNVVEEEVVVVNEDGDAGQEEVVVVNGDGHEGEEEGEGEEEEVGVVINGDEDEGEEEEEIEVEMDGVEEVEVANEEKEVVVVVEEDATDYSRIMCLSCGRFYETTKALENHQQMYRNKFYRKCGKCKNKLFCKADYELHIRKCKVKSAT